MGVCFLQKTGGLRFINGPIYSGIQKIPSAKNLLFRNSEFSEIGNSEFRNYRNWRFSDGSEFRLTGILRTLKEVVRFRTPRDGDGTVTKPFRFK